jgi:hypothetical protein
MARAKISMVVVAAIVLLLLISGTMASPGSRMLLQKCNGGCAAWKTVKGGKKVCGSCCTGYYMKVGATTLQRAAIAELEQQQRAAPSPVLA